MKQSIGSYKPANPGKYSSTGYEQASQCLPDRTTKSDIGKAVRPAGAPGPESKGSITPPMQVGAPKAPHK